MSNVRFSSTYRFNGNQNSPRDMIIGSDGVYIETEGYVTRSPRVMRQIAADLVRAAESAEAARDEQERER